MRSYCWLQPWLRSAGHSSYTRVNAYGHAQHVQRSKRDRTRQRRQLETPELDVYQPTLAWRAYTIIQRWHKQATIAVTTWLWSGAVFVPLSHERVVLLFTSQPKTNKFRRNEIRLWQVTADCSRQCSVTTFTHVVTRNNQLSSRSLACCLMGIDEEVGGYTGTRGELICTTWMDGNGSFLLAIL